MLDASFAARMQLPVLPAAVVEVIASFGDANLDAHELARKIGIDQGLSARMLRVANSSFYGMPRQVASIQDAVMVLGFGSVRSLALAAGIAAVFPQAAAAFAWPGYWKRSMLAGVYARALAGCLKVDRETAFSAGLFHDIGLAVLACCAPQELSQAEAAAGEGDLLAAERAVLGFDHAELGGEVVRRWNFPVSIEQAIRHRCAAPGPECSALDRVAHAAHLLSVAEMAGTDVAASLPAETLAALGLDSDGLRLCLPAVADLEAAAAALLNS